MIEIHSSQEKIGRTKIVYKNHFRIKGDFNKLLSHLQSDKLPDVKGFETARLIKLEKVNDKSLKKIVRSKLPPIDSFAKHLVTFDYVDIEYDLAHDDGIITSICRNPSQLKGKFNFTEEVVFFQEDDEHFIFERKATVSNKASSFPIFGSAFSHFNDYFNRQSILTYLKMCSEC